MCSLASSVSRAFPKLFAHTRTCACVCVCQDIVVVAILFSSSFLADLCAVVESCQGTTGWVAEALRRSLVLSACAGSAGCIRCIRRLSGVLGASPSKLCLLPQDLLKRGMDELHEALVAACRAAKASVSVTHLGGDSQATRTKNITSTASDGPRKK